MDEFLASLYEAHNEVMESIPLLNTNMTEVWNRPGVMSAASEFMGAIAWDEPFFHWLFMFHFVLVCVVFNFCLHRDVYACAGLFGLLASSVFAAEQINAFGSANYETLFPLHKTNYFDASGTFVSAFFSAPVLFLAFIIQLRMLASVAKMLVVVKRHQAREHAVRVGKEAIEGGVGGSSPSVPAKAGGSGGKKGSGKGRGKK